MKKKNVLIITLLIIIVMLLIVDIFLRVKKSTNNIVEEKLNDDKIVNNILFSNILFTQDEDKTSVKLLITNKNEKTVILNGFFINLYDKDNNKIGYFEPYTTQQITSQDNLEITISKQITVDDAYKTEFLLPNIEYLEEE